MLGLPWKTEEELRGFDDGARWAEFLRLCVLRDYSSACAEGKRVLEREPGDGVFRIWVAALLYLAGGYAQAAEQYRALLTSPTISPSLAKAEIRAAIAGAYAWALFMQDDEGVFEEAERWSAEAMRLSADRPNQPSILGTRGAILVARGHVTEGADLIRQALRRNRSSEARANNLACLALAAARCSEADRARNLLARALRLDPHCELERRVLRELAHHDSSASPAA
jgi:tetratricopeptide (TPR) repeat protein